jgi:hypothetical protein
MNTDPNPRTANFSATLWTKIKDFVEKNNAVVQNAINDSVHLGPDKVNLAPLDSLIVDAGRLRGEIQTLVGSQSVTDPASVDTDDVGEAMQLVDNLWIQATQTRGQIMHDAAKLVKPS